MKISKPLITVKPITAIFLSLIIAILIPIHSLQAASRGVGKAQIVHTSLLPENSNKVGFVLILILLNNQDENDIELTIPSMVIGGEIINPVDCTYEKVSRRKAKIRLFFVCELPENGQQLIEPGLLRFIPRLVALDLTNNSTFPVPVTGANFLFVTGRL